MWGARGDSHLFKIKASLEGVVMTLSWLQEIRRGVKEKERDRINRYGCALSGSLWGMCLV